MVVIWAPFEINHCFERKEQLKLWKYGKEM